MDDQTAANLIKMYRAGQEALRAKCSELLKQVRELQEENEKLKSGR